MKLIMLDTNICIWLLNKKSAHHLKLWKQLSKLKPSEVCISSITASELYFGVSNSQHPEKNRAALDLFLSPLEVASYDQEAGIEYGKVRSELKRLGTPIGPNDTLIAAHALSLECVLVTNNLGEFSRVKGLKLLDWTK